MSDSSSAERNRVRRLPARGAYDRETIYGIVDEAIICHVGLVQDGQPFVIPTIHARNGDRLLFHGAPASRLIQHIAAGHEICVAITILDGLVLARSVAHHSMNYRSVVLFGRGEIVADAREKLDALEAITEHVMPGRWTDAPPPTFAELAATTVVALSIEAASAKIRSGPPGDDAADYAQPIWAGVVPIRQVALSPMPDPQLADGFAVPDYIQRYVGPR